MREWVGGGAPVQELKERADLGVAGLLERTCIIKYLVGSVIQNMVVLQVFCNEVVDGLSAAKRVAQADEHDVGFLESAVHSSARSFLGVDYSLVVAHAQPLVRLQHGLNLNVEDPVFILQVGVKADSFSGVGGIDCVLGCEELNPADFDAEQVFNDAPGDFRVAHNLAEHEVVAEGELLVGFESVFHGIFLNCAFLLYMKKNAETEMNHKKK